MLTKTMVVPAARMRAMTGGAASSPMWPDQDNGPSGSIIDRSGGAPSATLMMRVAPA